MRADVIGPNVLGGNEIAGLDQRFQPGQSALKPLGKAVSHDLRLLVDDRHRQGVLRLKVEVQSAFGEPRPGDDVLEADLGVGPLGELARSRAQNLLARAIGSGAGHIGHRPTLQSAVAAVDCATAGIRATLDDRPSAAVRQSRADP